MKRPMRLIVFIAMLVLAESRRACAGMPMATLSDIAEMRLEAISFFDLLPGELGSGLVDLELRAKRLSTSSLSRLLEGDWIGRTLGAALCLGPDHDLGRT
jgi:hypothetical protein